MKLTPENYLIDTNYIKMRTIFDDLNEEVKSLSSSKRATFFTITIANNPIVETPKESKKRKS